MKEHKFPDNSFIGGWYIDPKICDDLINFFNNKKEHHTLGLTEGAKKPDKKTKESIDFSINPEYFVETFPSYWSEFKKCLNLYYKKYSFSNIAVTKFGLTENVKIQYYKKNWGYKIWHMEKDGYSSTLNRHLVFMTYLNDVDDGGTEFFYQKITSPAKKGLTLIWPTAWTHTHRGQISKTKEKYILTSWLNFYE